MLIKRLLGALAVVPMLGLAAPIHAQTAAPPSCTFQFGFATLAELIPNDIGTCTSPEMFDADGNAIQQTSTGLFSWSRSTNVTEFTNGENTWVNSTYGLIMRSGSVSYPWEGAVSLVAGIEINKDGQAINPATGQVIPKDARIQLPA